MEIRQLIALLLLLPAFINGSIMQLLIKCEERVISNPWETLFRIFAIAFVMAMGEMLGSLLKRYMP